VCGLRPVGAYDYGVNVLFRMALPYAIDFALSGHLKCKVTTKNPKRKHKIVKTLIASQLLLLIRLDLVVAKLTISWQILSIFFSAKILQYQ